MPSRSRLLSMLCTVVAFVLIGATSAWAQSYYSVTQQTVGSRWIAPPASATTITALTGADDSSTSIATPFPIPYWGSTYSSCLVNSNGYVSFGGAGQLSNYTPVSMPIASGASNDGLVA